MEEPDRRNADGEREPDALEEPAPDDAARTDEISDPVELRARLGIKNNHITELYEQITAARLAADEARASKEASDGRISALEAERARLRERARSLEEELRERRRWREGSERQVGRLEREVERLRGEIARRDHLLQRREEEMEEIGAEAEDLISRKDEALADALRRVEGLERDLEERETEAAELRATIDALRGELAEEHELRRRLAEPANRLRAGIDLFNGSEQRRQVNSLSRTLGQPEVHVALDEGEEPPVILSFTWRGITWQTYAADPGLAVAEPRIYLKSAGEDLSGVEREPPNARVGPGGRVLLGL